MVIVILSAMAETSNVSYLLTSSDNGMNVSTRCSEISRYILLNEGNPQNWGKDGTKIPKIFGLTRPSSSRAYDLDVDKVTRCNSRNILSLTYAQVYAMLEMPDISFEIEVKPIFDVEITQTAEFTLVDQTIYQFKISTKKAGLPVDCNVKAYVFAEAHFDSSTLKTSNGEVSLNLTLPNIGAGPALLAVLASSAADRTMVSFASYVFAVDPNQTVPDGSFLNLSPLNHSLIISVIGSDIALSETYAITMDHNSTLQLSQLVNGTCFSSLPLFVDSGPILIVATGHNDTSFFTEWTSYPEVPLRFGAKFDDVWATSGVFSNEYIITLGSSVYSCVVRVSGLD